MGKTKKKHNWKARELVQTKIDKQEEQKIKVDFESREKYDDCNALVLPSKKRKTKIKRPQTKATKLLSKAQRKKLEKIVERKKKKENRAAMIEALSQVQISSEELSKLTSITEIQTKGIKRRYNEGDDENWLKKLDLDALKYLKNDTESEDQAFTINSVKGSRKRRRMLAAMFPADKEKKKIADPNIVGFENTSSENESTDDESNFANEDNIKVEQISEGESLEEDKVPEYDSDAQSSSNCHEPAPVEIPELDERKDNGNKSSSQVVLNTKKINENASTESKSNSEKEKCPVKTETAVFIPVHRNPTIQAARLKLPILAEEQIIMETINENPIVIIAGETGSGKTTQVPQFLYEAGYARNGKVIGITEPRRVAAISMAKRVGEELNLSCDQVSYLIRFEGNVTPDTQIKFMTDGVLLKEIQKDFLLTKYSVIILDEAHERSVYTDILMGLLSRIVPLRHKRNIPLKLIIMSATLRIEDFTENKHLFKITPPVLKVESRQFPVTVHFNKRTNPDYLREAFRKVCKIHTQLPDGGILVFVTGQQEVNGLVNKLSKAFPMKNKTFWKKKIIEEEKQVNEDGDEIDLNLDRALQKAKLKKKEISLPNINLDSYEMTPKDDTDLDLFEEMNDLEENWGEEEIAHHNAQPLWVLPLYSILPSKKQAKVFVPAPDGTRLCVIATNVAETSLTIPGIKYVVDTGKVKTKHYDKLTGVSAYSVIWASKAAANQRAGRAGRTSAGHCYRIYSSAVYDNDFEEWSTPEMQRKCVDELVLQMKSLGIDRVVNFPFPSPPDSTQLEVAERTLTILGALDKPQFKDKNQNNGKLTELGKLMARFPVSPRFSKMLCLSYQAKDVFQYIVAIVSASSVQEVLLTAEDNVSKQKRASWAGKGAIQLLGDAMVLLRATGAGEHAYNSGKLEEFCLLNKIRAKAIIEARKIRIQLIKEINLLNPSLNLPIPFKLIPPDAIQTRLMRQIILAGMVDHVARKCSDVQQKGRSRPLYNTPMLEENVQIHSSSALYRNYPEWIVYQEIFQVSEKMYMRGIVAIEPEWLPIYAPTLCQLGSPLDNPPPRYDSSKGTVHCHVKATFGRSGWELPVVEIDFPAGLDKYKWFSVFILDGSVFPKLRKFTKSLLSIPQTMIRSWAKLQPRTEFLLKTLVSKEVDNKSKLLQVWESEKTFMLTAYQKWLPESAHNDVALIWPPI